MPESPEELDPPQPPRVTQSAGIAPVRLEPVNFNINLPLAYPVTIVATLAGNIITVVIQSKKPKYITYKRPVKTRFPD